MRLKAGIMAMLLFAKIFSGAAEENSAVVENLFAEPLPAVTNAPPKLLPKLAVRSYQIEGNTTLPAAEFNFLTNYTGEVDFARIREGLGKLQLRYRDLGFPTISVTLPPQKLTNGVVRVKVIEGKISGIVVTGNDHYSAENIRRALPSLTTNILINTKWFQPELDRANLNLNRQIYPVIAPGPEPGTTELTLKVKDQLPLHGHMAINDYSTPNTPLLRLDTALQYDNLWRRDHQVGLDYNFSPQEMKAGDHNFYDEPMVASYSGYYRLPLGLGHGLRENYENLPVTFGYDEATHRFNLPPATGNPDLIFFASRANSDTRVLFGPLKTIFDNATNQLAKIYQQSAQRTPTVNDDAGARLTVPLREFLGIKSSVQAAIDYKAYSAQTYSTNLTYFNLYKPDPFDPTQFILSTNQTVALPSNSRNSLFYLPLSLRWIGTRADKTGSTSFSAGENIFLQPLASARSDFQAVAGSPKAGGNYTTVNASLVRLQNLPGGWSALFNANGQWASAPLISNEQFALGGLGGVRGYQAGESYGDNGWRTQFDLRAPPVNVGYFPTPDGDVPAYLRCSVFMDYGEVYHLDSALAAIQQWGTGAGFYLAAGNHFDARLTLAYALLATPVTPVGSVQAYFSVGCQF